MNNHIVRADSKGPVFSLVSDEHSIINGNQIEVEISNVSDSGIGVDKGDSIYSFDGGATWVKDTSKIYAISTNAEIQVKDKLGNITANPIQTIYACSSGDGDATASQILSGKTAWVKGKKVTGTMVNRGAVSQTLNAGGSYTIPEGYHNGSGKITASSLSSQTQANATASQILSGRTAWVNGSKVTGTMANRGNLNWKPSNGTTYTVPAGYYSGGTLDSTSAYNNGYVAGYQNSVSSAKWQILAQYLSVIQSTAQIKLIPGMLNDRLASNEGSLITMKKAGTYRISLTGTSFISSRVLTISFYINGSVVKTYTSAEWIANGTRGQYTDITLAE